VSDRLAGSGNDIPSGKKSDGETETVFRTFGQFKSFDDIKNLVVNFFGNDVPVKISDVATVTDTLVDETSRAYINGEFATEAGKPKITVIRDGSVWIRANIFDVQETFITGLALSLSVGLLIDDAIVVRENIFRHMEMGKSPMDAARQGTAEVKLAVIGTTLAVIAVFGPLVFLSGVVGQFFKQFGLTVCFAMAILLFDALTMAPMMSAYLAGNTHKKPGSGNSLYDRTIGQVLLGFSNFQDWLEV